MPAPALVRPPEPVISELTVVLPTPVSVSRLPSLSMPPLSVRVVPVLAPMVAADPSVIAPEAVLLPEAFSNAPALPTPAPFSVSASAVPAPDSARVAPPVTVVPPAAVPNADALPTVSVPAFTVVVPV